MTNKRIDYVAFVSYGNDSIALIQYLYEHEVENVLCLFSDTGWASPSWMERVEEGEELARRYGFLTDRTVSVGFESLIRRRKMWPTPGRQFCTIELKAKPALRYLDRLDPEKEVVCVCVE